MSIPLSTFHSLNLQTPQDILDNLLSGILASKIRSLDLSLPQVGLNGIVNPDGSLRLAQELKHNSDGPHGRNRVGNSTSLNIRSGAVARLTNGKVVTNVGGRNNTQGADQSSSTIGQDITVQVRGNNDVVVRRGQEKLVDHGVDNLLLDVNGAVAGVLGDGADGLAEKTIGLGKNVGLVGDGELSTVVVALGALLASSLAGQGELKSNLSDASRGTLGDTLDGLGDLGAILKGAGGLLLDVEILGVLADDDEVGVGVYGLDGADVGVEIELLAESDDGRGVAGYTGGRRGNGTEESTLALVLEYLDGLVRKRVSSALEGTPAGLKVDEIELESERSWEGFEDAATGGNDLKTDAITGDET